jgi:ATP-dependent helicase/nuclease subunit A
MPEPAPPKLAPQLTDAQRLAINTVDRSILVSAAAGSGKTTVLAERCAALVCDAPEPYRCEINALLVVTFTDAAAAEMRSRIREAIRRRREQQPRNEYLERQLQLLDTASISTIHSFCKTLIQRWFPQAGIDPQATMLAEDEADLLRREVLDALFVELYAENGERGRTFQALVDEYGSGDDEVIAEAVLRAHSLASSLPDPQGWLGLTSQRLGTQRPDSLASQLDELQRGRLTRELELQVEYCRHFRDLIARRYSVAGIHINTLDELATSLEGWKTTLSSPSQVNWQVVAAGISEHKFETTRRPSKLSDDEKQAYDAAKKLRDKAIDLFKTRLQEACCRFTADEYREGLDRIAPYAATLVNLTSEFDLRYSQAKAAQAALDFNDLQRCAFQLLSDNGAPGRPSEVARQLQQQYRYVLVDEFQDVDPLQEAILRLASRETADPPQGNLFAVGDIKQSIYRFRLADPDLFAARADDFDSGSPIGTLIPLQDNFRSRGAIIDAINLIFEPLMSRSFGGSNYDEKARLHAGANYPGQEQVAGVRLLSHPAVELHLLEPITEATRQVEDDENGEGPSATDELEGIDREAFLIGQRIQDWMGFSTAGAHVYVADKPVTPGGLPTTRPIEYRDIVILLRSLPHKAEPIANVLRRMGIPVQISRDEAGIDSTEFRDVASLLSILDNQQQDIPLAAVLRSPICGDPFNETELLTIRLLDREAPFHQAVPAYASRGPDPGLRERLAAVLATLDRFRTRIRRAPVAEVLWQIYQETRYMAFVASLPDGTRRRERLIQLHDLAREFGQFHRQGLRRFLRFLKEILTNERSGRLAGAPAGGDNVVRIMTVHTSKGLEFPVVILADLAKPFNLSDLRRPILIDRQFGLALQAADPDRRIFYPTLIHQLAAESGHHQDLSEELRVLYVALTRAKEHLVLVGRTNLDALPTYRLVGPEPDPASSRIPSLQLQTAPNSLTWLLASIGTAPPQAARWPDEPPGQQPPLIELTTYPRAVTDRWRIPPAIEEARTEALAAPAGLGRLPADEPISASPAINEVISSLDTLYPALALTTLPARVSVSELKRRWSPGIDPDERPGRVTPGRLVPVLPAFLGTHGGNQAVGRGIATHRFCQLLDLARPCDARDLAAQLQELIDNGRLAPNDAVTIPIDDVAWFWSTPLGEHILAHATDTRREVAFVSPIPPEKYDPLVSACDTRDVLLVRGTVDLVICHPDHLEILDYKTDVIRPGDAAVRAEAYRPQLDNYSMALQGIYQRPVTNQWLVFLHGRSIFDLYGG